MLSKKTRYAIRALLFLTEEFGKGPVLIGNISEKQNIPKKFLESILLELKNNGFLSSRKGKGGGYYLLKKPNEISLADIIRLFDGAIGLLPCVTFKYYEKCTECPDENTCGLRNVLKEVRDASVKILKANTLQDIVDRENLLKSRL